MINIKGRAMVRVETVPKGRHCGHCFHTIEKGKECIYVPGMGRFNGKSFHIECYKKHFIDPVKKNFTILIKMAINDEDV
jgi:hypothetical protein